MSKILNAIKSPKKILQYLMNQPVGKLLSDEQYLSINYWLKMGKKLDLKTPKTFNEKLQWLKLNDRKDYYTDLVDKCKVKKIVAEKIGEEYIIPTIAEWESFDKIDFDALPNQFVLKCNHDSGGLAICTDKSKFDMASARKKITKSKKINYYWKGREWPYKNVEPKVFAEKYIEDKSGEFKDYKFMCFNGEVKCSFVCSERFSPKGLHVTFFDNDWNVMPFERHYPSRKEGLPKPVNFQLMKDLAETLSKDIPFVRIDFYEVDGKVYFGEYTFYPGSGLEEFTPEEWDYKLGEWIKL